MLAQDPASQGACPECGEPLPTHNRGRPATYCSHACRQAAYRRRRQAAASAPLRPTPREDNSPAPPPSPEDQQLLDLAAEVRDELGHLIRLLTPGKTAALRTAPADCAHKITQQVDALLAGTVRRARRNGVSWDSLARILNTSPETARRSYHADSVRRRMINLGLDEASPLPRADSDNGHGGPPVPLTPRQKMCESGASTSPSLNQLAPVLSRLQQRAQIPLRRLGQRAGVSASYLSRILTGERLPTWPLTERIGRALGADLCTLRRIWDDERYRLLINQMRSNTNTDSPPGPAHELASSLRALHQHCGSPSPRAIAIVLHHRLTPQEITDVLNGVRLPSWEQTEQLIRTLQGDPASFRQAWEAARQPSTPRNPTSPEAGEPTPSQRLDDIFSIFGRTLSSPAPALVPAAPRPRGDEPRDREQPLSTKPCFPPPRA